MKKKKLFAAALGAAGACALFASQAQATVPMTEMPMLDCDGMACVQARTADGAELRLFIDTGGVRGSLDRGRLAALNIPIEPVIGPDGKPHPTVARTVIRGLSLGQAKLGDVPLIAYDIAGSRAKVGKAMTADGSLGYAAFADRIVELDYAHHVVRISDKLGEAVPCEGDCGRIEMLTFGKKGPPMVIANGFKVGGKEVWAQIDTLYTGTMLVYPQAVEKLGLTAQAGTTEKEFFPFTDGGVDMLRSNGTVGFGSLPGETAPLYFATEKVHLPDGLFDATVGVGYFQGKVVTINMHDKWVKVAEAR